MTSLARSSLHPVHTDLGARFTGFGGWEMPLQYEGTLAEHAVVRESVGVFDVSHLGRFEVSGPEARRALDNLLCNDLNRIKPGRAQYTMMLTESGGVVDDIIVWWLPGERFIVLPNGANHATVLQAMSKAGADAEDLRPTTALLAVQGPDSPRALQKVLGAMPPRFGVVEAGGALLAGTGYTGERGAEVIIGHDRAAELFGALLEAGAGPCGLGARDTLRLEMGYPLWGQDLDTGTSPLEAGLEWVVGWEHEFVGKEALVRQKERGLDRRLVGFAFEDRRVPRHGYPIRSDSSRGEVTSGNFSPTLGVGIGMGYLSPPADAPELEVEVRGRWTPARRVEPPFVER